MEQFTWQQFLVAALVFSLIWYAGVALIFYNKEIKAFLNGKQRKKENREPLPHRWEKGVEEVKDNDEETLMGKTKMPDGISIVESSDFGFVGGASSEDQIGLVPDVLEDIKMVFQLLVKEDGNKKDFFKLMEEVNKSYPKIGSNPNIRHINEFIRDHAPFHLSEDELESIWY